MRVGSAWGLISMTGSQGEGRRTARRDDGAGAVAQVCVPRRRCLGRGGQCCPRGPRHERGESQLCPPSAVNSAPWAQRWEAVENSSWCESPDSYRQTGHRGQALSVMARSKDKEGESGKKERLNRGGLLVSVAGFVSTWDSGGTLSPGPDRVSLHRGQTSGGAAGSQPH